MSGVSGDRDLGIGGQILDTHIKFEGVGIEIWVSGVRGLGSGSGCHAWDLGGLGSGDCMVIQSSNLRDLGIQDWDPGYPGTGIWGWDWDEWIRGQGEALRARSSVHSSNLRAGAGAQELR